MRTGASAADRRRAFLISLAALAISLAATNVFNAQRVQEPILAGPGVSRQSMLSVLEPSLADGPGDTALFELSGEKPGGTILILGGTHPSETAGQLAAILLIENVRVKTGRIIVVPEANQSGFSYTEPMGAHFARFEIETKNGPRWFRVGMRLTNPADQWPDPDRFLHVPSDEEMIGYEARNLNRNHPGQLSGSLTARVSHALTGLAGSADLVIDLHESTPESPNVNSLIAHESTFETAAIAVGGLQSRRIRIALSASPKNLHGLSHREFGDHAGTEALILETANPSRGRFRGRTSLESLIEGREANYLDIAGLRPGILFTSFDESGWPLKLRVARHLAALEELLKAFNELHPDKPILVENIPPFKDLLEKGLGAFLLPPLKG